MLLFPAKELTLVSSLTKQEVLFRLEERTQIIKSDQRAINPLFNGTIEKEAFNLSLATNYSQNYLPLIKGKVEDTSRGSILFIKLVLFPAAKLYLIAFSVMAAIIAAIFIGFQKSVTIGTIALLVGIVNYLLLTVNFNRKAKEAVRELENLLSE